jgi:hypothetical protein
MADKEVKTSVILEAQAKGFEQAERQVTGLKESAANLALDEAYKKGEKAADGMIKSAEGLSKALSGQQISVTKLAESIKQKLEDIDKITYENAADQIKELKENLFGVEKQGIAMAKALQESGEKGSEEYQETKKVLKALEEQAKTTRKEIEMLTRAFMQAKPAQGALLQGFLQGVGPMASAFLQRGPGMGSQFLGQMLGTGARRMAMAGIGIAGSMFTGLGGLQQGIAQMPYMGGFFAGQLGAAAGHAGRALDWQKAQLELLPYFGSSGFLEKRASRKEEAEADWNLFSKKEEPPKPKFPEGVSATMILGKDNKMHAIPVIDAEVAIGAAKDIALEEQTRNVGRRGEMRASRLGWEAKGGAKQLEGMDLRMYQMDKATKDYEAQQLWKEEEQRKRTQLLQERQGSFGAVGGVGHELRGLDFLQSVQEAGQLIQAGGGWVGEATRRGAISTGFAAKTMYGVDYETSGGYLRAARRGGMISVGAEQDAGTLLLSGLKDAVTLGLTGAEVPEYLQTMVGQFQQWQTTGLPLNDKGFGRVALSLSQAGIAAPRAMEMTRGISNYLQGMGQRGIQSGLDLYMLHAVGGYKGGGAAGYVGAITGMESLKGSTEGLTKESPIGKALLGVVQMMALGSPAGQQIFMQKQLGKMGIAAGMEESGLILKNLTGAKLTSKEQMAINRENLQREQATPELAALQGKDALLTTAKKYIDELTPGLKKQSEIQNHQLEVGTRLLTAVQSLESSATNTNSAFASLASGPITRLSSAFESLTGLIDKLTNKWWQNTEAEAIKVGHN